jgi:hypothetical protein
VLPHQGHPSKSWSNHKNDNSKKVLFSRRPKSIFHVSTAQTALEKSGQENPSPRPPLSPIAVAAGGRHYRNTKKSGLESVWRARRRCRVTLPNTFSISAKSDSGLGVIV